MKSDREEKKKKKSNQTNSHICDKSIYGNALELVKSWKRKFIGRKFEPTRIYNIAKIFVFFCFFFGLFCFRSKSNELCWIFVHIQFHSPPAAAFLFISMHECEENPVRM